jgi:CxxC motif-containing protein (DUF1111 family)
MLIHCQCVKTVVGILSVGLLLFNCVEPETNGEKEQSEWLSGGSQTVFNSGAGAFSSVFPNLNANLERVHAIGDGAFGQTFVSRPATINPGLGPIFNNVSCTSCHVNDGRGKPPVGSEQIASLLIRLSLPGTDEHGGPVAVPGFGLQLQQRGIFGVQPEALVSITYTEKEFYFSDGVKYTLRFPTYELTNPYTPLPAGYLISPRIAPPVFGLGLLEAIDESDILSHADVNDANDDQISGKPNYVWNVLAGKKTLGRFGWKANNPTLLQQSAGAYNEDMGITNFVFPKESSWDQPQYIQWDGGYDVTDSLLQSVSFYVRTLGVPARRNADNSTVLAGKQIFHEAKCAACHIPQMRTKVDVSFPELSNQVIYPYTDLLLHDMGPDLADNRPDFDADGREWRTAPLWGIGLTQVVNGHNNFLHDGRARTLMEAIMWHGGEAEASREHVRKLSKSERDALIKFLESL